MHLVYIGKKFYAFPQFTLKWAALAKVQKDQLTGSWLFFGGEPSSGPH